MLKYRVSELSRPYIRSVVDPYGILSDEYSVCFFKNNTPVLACDNGNSYGLNEIHCKNISIKIDDRCVLLSEFISKQVGK